MNDSGKKVIVNIDDTGNHPDTVEAAIELWHGKRISSVSLMAYGPDFDNTVAKLKKHGIPTGIHLGANHGEPVLPAKEVPSLCDDAGKFHDDARITLKRYKLEEMEREYTAQIEKTIAAGLQPRHLDCHMGLVYFRKSLMKSYLSLVKKFRLSASVPGFFYLNRLRKEVRLSGVQASDTMHVRYNLPRKRNDGFQGRYIQYDRILGRLKPGIHYIASHPIKPTEEVERLFDDSDIRFADFRFFSSPDWPELLKRHNIELIAL